MENNSLDKSQNNEEKIEESAKIEEENSSNINDLKDEKTAFGLIRPRILENEMRESYLDYAMSVIIARALPDVRDGLKPVHRRVLYSMHELGLSPQGKYRKSATVVGDVLGKYHPHGDIAVYDTLVRLAQDFSMRQKLVDGQGNFGSMDGDAPAAMRYTECRLTAAALEMMADINKETVDFTPNYDNTRVEPKVLPGRLPNLLINGSMGIAVGMATNIPPHNLEEVCQAICYLIDCPDCAIEDLMDYIKGPDFPTGAEIYGLEQIKTAYATGKGAIVMRAVGKIEESRRSFRIIISEIPYQVNKAETIAKIADLVKEKKLEGITDIRDESDRKEGVRIVIELKSNAYPKKILNRLYELTNLQTTFYTNMLALVDGLQPRVLTLKNILEEYLKHRKIVIRRRTQFLLQKAKERAHILEGLRIALKSIEEVISLIRKSHDRQEAGKKLKSKFKLTSQQVDAILEMRLAALAALEREKIEQEYQEKLKEIQDFQAILTDEKKILQIIKKELKVLIEKYATPRKTKIYPESLGKFSAEDLIPQESVIIILTRGNYIKRMPVGSYRSQIRGGKGVIGMETKEEDMIEHLISADTHDDIYFFTDRGRIFHTKVFEIPSASRHAKGQAIVNILQISPEEKVTAMITLSKKDSQEYQYILLATTKGIVKKTPLALYKKIRQTGIMAIKLKKDDRLSWVKVTTGSDSIFQVSAKGLSIFYNEKDIRQMGRTAGGVRGIHLRENDYVVSTDVILAGEESQTNALIVLEKGFGKRTPLTYFKKQLRGGVGMRAANVTSRTGGIVGMKLVFANDYDLILASLKGQMIRMALSSVKKLQRDTQGVILMRLNAGDKVTSVTVIQKEKLEKELDERGDEKGKPQEFLEEKVEKQLDNEIDQDEGKEKNERKNKGNAQQDEDEKKDQPAEGKTGKLPDWAKAHRDSWREPSVSKIPKNIKVRDYKKEEKSKKAKSDLDKKTPLNPPSAKPPKSEPPLKPSKSDEPNYWGGQL
ncbi:MAG: DNA gyrase subunit A [Patescibacteria group bacterium]